jgi:hypothetical protein
VTGAGFSNYTIINASGSDVNPVATGSLQITPIRTADSNPIYNTLLYNGSEIFLSSSTGATGGKTFVIPHPDDDTRYLVHACIEGPESGVYYRGESAITNGSNVKINLPNYVKSLATEFTVQLTPIFNGKIVNLASSRVCDNSFIVYGENCEFFWTVMAKRNDIIVEPLVSNVEVDGNGPYRWIKN